MKYSLEVTNGNMRDDEFHIFCLSLCVGEDCRLTENGVIYEGLEDKAAGRQSGDVEGFYREKISVLFEHVLPLFKNPSLSRQYIIRRIEEKEAGQDD